MPSTTRACKCKHTYQDEVYGKGVRVFNYAGGSWRCTVCSHEIKASDTEVKGAKSEKDKKKK